ncbi:MAG: hypothetical protein ABIL58_06010, partial [Pseudomonadota bacterium]
MGKVLEATHPSGEIIVFDDDSHTYTVKSTGERFISVTTVLGEYFPKFDGPGVAEKCSNGSNPKYAGRPAAEILAEWDAEGERGRTEGTNVHAYGEWRLLQTFGPPRVECPASISNRTAALFNRIDQFFPTLLKHYKFVAAELIIFSLKLKISGMIDLLMQCRKTGDFIVLDWKQNKEITM